MQNIKRAIYPGSFDPITFGHIDIAQRSLKIFDELIIAVGNNRDKNPMLSSEERLALVKEVFKDNAQVKVISFSGLLVDLARELNVFTVIRGLRAVSDFEYEFQFSAMNRKLDPRLELFFMMTSENHFYISSSLIKEVHKMGGDISCFAPEYIISEMEKKKK